MAFHSRMETAGSGKEALLGRFSDDLAIIENAWSLTASWGLLPLIEAVLYTALMFWLDWRAGIVSLALWPWILLAPRTVAHRATAAGRIPRAEAAQSRPASRARTSERCKGRLRSGAADPTMRSATKRSR